MNEAQYPLNISEFSQKMDELDKSADTVALDGMEAKMSESEYKKSVRARFKDARSLKKSRYEKNREKYKTTYIIRNIVTKSIAEIRAASSFHACKTIGWKPNQTRLMGTKINEE